MAILVEKKAKQKTTKKFIPKTIDIKKKLKIIDLKELPRKRFKHHFSFDRRANAVIFKLFSDFFNMIKQDKKAQKMIGIKIVCFLGSGLKFIPEVNFSRILGKQSVVFEYDNVLITYIFHSYYEGNELRRNFYSCSDEPTNLAEKNIYDQLFKYAIQASDLKGSHFTLFDDFYWTRTVLEKRNFNDIFLPRNLLDDIHLYIDLYDKKGKLMRYLQAGPPGTGKTETTLVIANLLKERGVTIIKTSISEYLRDKIEMAQTLAPSLIVLDDIDLQLGSRKKGVNPKHLTAFLDVLDGTNKIKKEDIGLIATTNSLELLDLAAQRPGRFDKTLVFDRLDLSNIKDIILKSLKYNFQINKDTKIAKMLTDKSIIKLYYDKRVTGAYIFNNIELLKNRIDVFDINNYDTKWLREEIQKELKINESITNKNHLIDKLNNGRGTDSIGFFDFEEEPEDGKMLRADPRLTERDDPAADEIYERNN